MNLAMMPTAERHRELVADLASDSARFGKAEMVCIARQATAHQTGLARHMPDVLAIPQATRFRNDQCSSIDRF